MTPSYLLELTGPGARMVEAHIELTRGGCQTVGKERLSDEAWLLEVITSDPDSADKLVRHLNWHSRVYRVFGNAALDWLLALADYQPN